MTNLFISLYPFYFIILAAKTATQITNTDIILPNLKTRLCIQIILVRRKQRRLNGKYVYIIISFLLHYSGFQNRHANYKHNTSNLKTRLCYIIRVPQKQRRLNDESVYIIISFLLHYSGFQNRHANYKHNTSNLKTRLCYIIRVPQKQRRLNDESVYIIISFLLHYSGCQNRHANYKYQYSMNAY